METNTKLKLALITTFVLIAGIFTWKYAENKSTTSKVQPSFQMQNTNSEKETELKISDKWTRISPANFWNNSDLFANRNYKFPNIAFSYPDNWDFQCCNDMDHASTHIIYSSKNRDKSLPRIRITNHVLSGCPDSQSTCSLDKIIKLTANEKFAQLTSSIPTENALPKITITTLNTIAFVYNDESSKNYIINLGNDVVEIGFVNYELLPDDFIEKFLNHLSLENK